MIVKKIKLKNKIFYRILQETDFTGDKNFFLTVTASGAMIIRYAAQWGKTGEEPEKCMENAAETSE